jgi:outer membrane lipoprotein LolB
VIARRARAGRSLLSAAAAALAGMLLAACAARPPLAGGETLSGRISVRVEASGNQPMRNVTAAFELRGNAESGELQLATPLGTVLATASWSPGKATLATADSNTDFSDLDALAYAALGENLPLRALPDWLHGRPWAGATSAPTAPPLDAGFEQLGWTVSLARFNEGWLLARREAPPAVTVRARLDATP